MVTAVSVGKDDIGYGSAIQPDGKVLFVGDSGNSSTTDAAIVRYDQNGSLDASFLDVGMQAADQSNVHCGIGRRLCALRVGGVRKKEHRRDESPGDGHAAAAMVHSHVTRALTVQCSTYNEMDEGES